MHTPRSTRPSSPDPLHNATLTALAHFFADIASTDEILARLAAQPGLAAAAE